MNATTLDLRYKTREIMNSLNRGESVVITFRGKPKGIIEPYREGVKGSGGATIMNHPFIGMWADDDTPVEEVMRRLRKGRCDDL